MFERYTDAAKRAIYFARFEAIHLDLPAISPRELLVGLTWDANTRADRIAQSKDNAVAWRAKVGIPHRPTTPISYQEKRHLPLTLECKRVILYAIEEANGDRQFYVDTDHLLRALLRIATQATVAIKESGLSLKSLRKASQEDRAKNPVDKAPWYWKPPLLYTPSDLWVVAILAVLIVLFAFGMIRELLIGGFGAH